MVFELRPFFENINKRVIKSPKLYFTDPGLAAFLLGIETAEQANRDPLRGGLYENFIILEFLKSRYNSGQRPDFYFYRDTRGNEVDLVYRYRGLLIPVEIKSAATFTKKFLSGFEQYRRVAKDRCAKDEGYVIYNGTETFKLHDIVIFNPLIHDAVEGLF